MQKIQSGDTVIVVAGKDKGKVGKVQTVVHYKANRRNKAKLDTMGFRIKIEGVNLVKRHVKANPQKEEPGGILEREAPIHVSNVAIYNPATEKADKVQFKCLEGGKKVRVYRSTGEVINA